MVTDKPKILIVDDDEKMADTLFDILKIKGYQSQVAYSGQDAFKKIKKSFFNCVISDVRMPGMNGIGLYKVIKNIQPNLAVLFMSAYPFDKTIREELKNNPITVLTKPLDVNLLFELLSQIMLGSTK